jgi:hypothetical protein
MSEHKRYLWTSEDHIVKTMISYDGNFKITDMFQGSGCVDIGTLVKLAVSEKSMVQEIFGMVYGDKKCEVSSIYNCNI